MSKIVEIYRYRELLKSLTLNELRLRYRRSVLGFLWTMLNPLLMMIVLTLVFSTVMRVNIENYSISLFAGLLPWSFLAQSVGTSLMSVVSKGSLLKKVYIPKALIPMSAMLSCLINFLLSFVPLLGLLVAVGKPLTWSLLFLPVSVLMMALFVCGLAFIFSCLNVFFRDFSHMTDVILQLWFYASPVLYTLDMVPEKYRPMFLWNPVMHLINCFRLPIMDGRLPTVQSITIAALAGVTMCAVGFGIFIRFERHFILRV